MERPIIIERWLTYFRCPSCNRVGLEHDASSKKISCAECGWASFATSNYADLLNTGSEYEKLAANYSKLFAKLDQGKLGDTQYYYSKTVDEEFEEFLEETRLSVEKLRELQILDAGCGIARLTEKLSISGADCVALDIHSRLYVYAQKYLNKPKTDVSPLYVRGSVERIPFAPCFDMVWCQGVLSYVPNPIRAIRELQRITEIGGCVYLSMYSSANKNIIYMLARMIRRFPPLVREPIYDLMALGWDNANALLQRLKGKVNLRKRQTRLHLRDFSISESILALSLNEVFQLFDDKHWKVVWIDGRGGVRCLAKKLK
jgi:2-polyprenyl-3-methyl-5-hydroxy-6-metoxy-1,4-benzoquinol methylase